MEYKQALFISSSCEIIRFKVRSRIESNWMI